MSSAKHRGMPPVKINSKETSFLMFVDIFVFALLVAKFNFYYV